MSSEPRRRGPKPKGPFEDKRKTLTTRITEQMRIALEGAANDSGRSLSQEIELRLERSFEPGRSLEKQLEERYGRHGALLLALIGRELLSRIPRATKGLCDTQAPWLDDSAAVRNVAQFIALALRVLGPDAVASDALTGGWGWLVALADPTAGSGFGALLRELAGQAISERAAARFEQYRGAGDAEIEAARSVQRKEG